MPGGNVALLKQNLARLLGIGIPRNLLEGNHAARVAAALRRALRIIALRGRLCGSGFRLAQRNFEHVVAVVEIVAGHGAGDLRVEAVREAERDGGALIAVHHLRRNLKDHIASHARLRAHIVLEVAAVRLQAVHIALVGVFSVHHHLRVDVANVHLAAAGVLERAL